MVEEGLAMVAKGSAIVGEGSAVVEEGRRLDRGLISADTAKYGFNGGEMLVGIWAWP